MRPMRKLLILPLVAGALVLAGCSRQQPNLVGSQTDNITANEVLIIHNSFIPHVLTVNPGTTVTWRWDDGPTPHNVMFDTSGLMVMSPNQRVGTFTHTFDTPGTYHYQCTLHINMTGEIVVR